MDAYADSMLDIWKKIFMIEHWRAKNENGK